jgi:hypothetical protein
MNSKKTRNGRSTAPSRRNSSDESLRELARMARATVKDEASFRQVMQIVVDAGSKAGITAKGVLTLSQWSYE